ncbi:MAG: hypothetical protein OSA98_09635 [Rubripirellula sp.]|nr:hypothetical protein [Rubripirellula sp.]
MAHQKIRSLQVYADSQSERTDKNASDWVQPQASVIDLIQLPPHERGAETEPMGTYHTGVLIEVVVISQPIDFEHVETG